MASKKIVREDLIKKFYETSNEDQLLLEFTDNFVTSDGEKKGKIKGKSHSNADVSSHLSEYLESYHIMTHYISRLDDAELSVKKTEELPVDVVITNVASGSICRRFGLEEAMVLDTPIIEYVYENEKIKNPLINDSHMVALKLATAEEIRSMVRILPKVNAVLKSFFERRKLHLVEFRARFGRYKGHIILTSTLGIECFKVWDAETRDKYEVDRFASNPAKFEEIFQVIHSRIMGESE